MPVECYDGSQFHPKCVGVQLVEIAGRAFLFCSTHRCAANLQAVAPRYATWADAGIPAPRYRQPRPALLPPAAPVPPEEVP